MGPDIGDGRGPAGAQGPAGSTGPAGPSALLGTQTQLLTAAQGAQVLSTTGAWTNVPGLVAFSFTGAIGDFVSLTSKGTASAATGSFTADYYHFLHVNPDLSMDAALISTGSTPTAIGTIVLTQAGTHTIQLQYYFTGAAPVVTYNAGAAVAGYPISMLMIAMDHRSSAG